jgi:DNA sulfur modification protein DndE
MTWRVFGGSHEQIYAALLRARAQKSGLVMDPESLAAYFRVHLQRGIAMLYPVRSLHDLAVLLTGHGNTQKPTAISLDPDVTS